MRVQKRIGRLLEIVDWNKLWTHLRIEPLTPLQFSKFINQWYEFPGSNVLQILANLDFITFQGHLWMTSDVEIFTELGYEPREFVYWGNTMDEGGRIFDRTNWILIRDLDTNHVKNIIKHIQSQIPAGVMSTSTRTTIRMFENELEFRKQMKQ
jgi:hypothetical protein